MVKIKYKHTYLPQAMSNKQIYIIDTKNSVFKKADVV